MFKAFERAMQVHNEGHPCVVFFPVATSGRLTRPLASISKHGLHGLDSWRGDDVGGEKLAAESTDGSARVLSQMGHVTSRRGALLRTNGCLWFLNLHGISVYQQGVNSTSMLESQRAILPGHLLRISVSTLYVDLFLFLDDSLRCNHHANFFCQLEEK